MLIEPAIMPSQISHEMANASATNASTCLAVTDWALITDTTYANVGAHDTSPSTRSSVARPRQRGDLVQGSGRPGPGHFSFRASREDLFLRLPGHGWRNEAPPPVRRR